MKRKRSEITGQIKKKLCQHKLKNPNLKQSDLVIYASRELNIDVGKSTIGDILRHSDKWLSLPQDSSGMTRARAGKHEDLEKALFIWFSDVTSHHAAVNDDMLITKARGYGEQMGVENFQYSRGWLQNFKSRYGIKSKTYEGEAASADLKSVETGREDLRKLLLNYKPEDVFNQDETGLFYRLGPNSTLATGRVKGKKKSKERVTISLCSNATGTEKCKPFLIAKVKRPRCFGKTYNPECYVRYRHNKTAWMNSVLFTEWLSEFDRKMKSEKRNVILLVDNAGSHALGDVKLTNVKVHFLPPNTTAYLQPMDAGIIKCFKSYYRRQLIKTYIECAEKDQKQTVDMKQVIQMVKTSWDEVTPKTINNCFRHASIMDQLKKAEKAKNQEEEDTVSTPVSNEKGSDSVVTEIKELLQHPALQADMTAQDYIQIDSTVETGKSLTDEDILKMLDFGDDEDGDDEEDDDDEAPVDISPEVTSATARDCVKTLITYFEQTPDELDKSVSALNNLLEIQKLLDEKLTKNAVQRKVTDFFKLNC